MLLQEFVPLTPASLLLSPSMSGEQESPTFLLFFALPVFGFSVWFILPECWFPAREPPGGRQRQRPTHDLKLLSFLTGNVQDRPAANGNAQTAQVQDGTAQAYDEHVTMLENAFLSTRGVDQAAADNMVHLYSHIKNCLGDGMVTQVVDVFKVPACCQLTLTSS